MQAFLLIFFRITSASLELSGYYQTAPVLVERSRGILVNPQGDFITNGDIEDLLKDCCISIANALEILQSCTKPSIWPQLNASQTNVVYTVNLANHILTPMNRRRINHSFSINSMIAPVPVKQRRGICMVKCMTKVLVIYQQQHNIYVWHCYELMSKEPRGFLIWTHVE